MVYILIFVLGLCIGSFINALVWRLGANKKSKKYSILRGRSICPNCKNYLAWYDLVPLLSWVVLRGKCRYCKKPISIQYPLVELITAILFLVSYVFWPNELLFSWQYVEFATWLILLTGLLALAIYDLIHMLLPDAILKPLFVVSIASIIIQVLLGRDYVVFWHILLSMAIAGGIFWIIYQYSRGKWIGGGDVKLGFLVGTILIEPQLSFLYLFIASILGTLYSVPLLLSKKIKPSSKVPFGPFLIASAVIVMLFGRKIVELYLSILDYSKTLML